MFPLFYACPLHDGILVFSRDFVTFVISRHRQHTLLALCASGHQTQCPVHHAHQSHLSIGIFKPSPNPKILAGGHAMSVTQTLRYASTTILTDSPTGTGGNQKDGDDVRDPLTNPATSRIVKVTIACAIVVLGITGLITGFKVSVSSDVDPSRFPPQDAHVSSDPCFRLCCRSPACTDLIGRLVVVVRSKRPSLQGVRSLDG